MNTTKIIAGGYTFTCNERKDAGAYNIAVRANLIVDLSRDLDGLKRKYPEAEIEDVEGKIILPTFFNSHFHPEAIVCRSVEPRDPISQWREDSLLNVELSVESQNEAFFEKLYHLAFFSALQCGVSGIAFSLIGDEAGARGMYSALKLAGIDAVAFAESDSQTSFLKRVVDKHLKYGGSVPYQKDLTLFGLSAVARINSESPGWIMAHADESEDDVVITRSNFNSGLIQLLKKSKLLGANTILVGLNGTQANSLRAARSEDAKVVLTPTELSLQNFRSIRNVFEKFAIGSNWKTPGLFEEMKRLLEFGVTPHEVLVSATRYGADMFNMGSKSGSIEIGKLANFTFVDTRKYSARRIEKFSLDEAAAAFIEDYTDSDVSDVMLEGEFVCKDRKLLLYNGDELMQEGADLVETVLKYKETIVSEVKYSSPKAPSTREEDTTEMETDNGKVELPKNIRKVFGEDEF
ncbi:MAG TPA: amidohydrolase family protein [Candidatus Acidoferrales bacterium]|nr:amidohydrolase family protein [Candidatus Acidoferrales bacterium]